MSQLNLLIAVCLSYVALLFLVAFVAERAAARGRGGWLRSPVVYTLSLSIYCTGWTFYGAVGNAARSGMEYLTIYIGPSLVMMGWWWVLRKLVRIGRTHRITSIADLVSSRFGKSNLLAIGLTILAVLAITPYIALQLQSVTQSVQVFAATEIADDGAARLQTGFWVALGLGFFTVLFG
ncbi:MAG: sodium:solute symporter, partial [Paracoccaceae bacterium]